MIWLCLFCVTIILPGVLTEETIQKTEIETGGSRGTFGWIEDGTWSLLDTLLPDDQGDNFVEARKKKKKKYTKYLVPLIAGFLLVKSILLPIALKGLAVLSGKAVILSLMSLILAAIVGLKKVAQSSGSNYEVVNVPLSKYRRNDELYRRSDAEDDMPYRYYRERRRRK